MQLIDLPCFEVWPIVEIIQSFDHILAWNKLDEIELTWNCKNVYIGLNMGYFVGEIFHKKEHSTHPAEKWKEIKSEWW